MKVKAQKTQVQGSAQPEQPALGVDKEQVAGFTPCHEMNQNAITVPVNLATTPTAVDGLAQGLVAALQAGLTEKAAELARELANLNVKCEIKVLHETNKQRDNQAEFSVKVHVEDRVADRCFVSIRVKTLDTIEDLKRKMMILHNLPMEVQRWIIGKKIHPDHTTLYQCGVRGPGHTIYLYLVTARSVGLNKENYEAQLQAIMLMKQPRSQISQQTLPGANNQSVNFDPASRGDMHMAALNPSNLSSNGDSLDQTDVVPLSRPGFYPSPSSVSPGSMRLQEMLQSPNLSGFSPNPPTGTPGTPEENVLTHASPGLSAEAWAHNNTIVPVNPSTAIPVSISDISNITPQADYLSSFTPGPPNEDDEQGEGWECPACTYRNLPMWPGCEMCDQPCPEEYQVPENYVMTEREIHLLENEHMEMHERQERGTNLPQQHKHEVSPSQSVKLGSNLELLQNLQAAQITSSRNNFNSSSSGNNVNRIPDAFVSDNSIILRNLSDDLEDQDLRTVAPQPTGDLSGFPQAFPGTNLVPPYRLMPNNVLDGNRTSYISDAIFGPGSSDEENSQT